MVWRQSWYTVVTFGVTLLVVRMAGKKEVSQLTFWDLVSAIAMGSLAANAAVNRDAPLPLWLWTIGLWGLLTVAIDWLAINSRRLRGVVQGKPTVVIQNGRILEESMRAERYNTDILLSQLRAKGIFRVADVEFAVLEPDGTLSVLPKSQRRPVTPADLGLSTQYEGLAKELVMDGRIVPGNLQELGLSQEWLAAELARQGIADLSHVVFAELSADGNLYVDRRQDGVGREHDPSDQADR